MSNFISLTSVDPFNFNTVPCIINLDNVICIEPNSLGSKITTDRTIIYVNTPFEELKTTIIPA